MSRKTIQLVVLSLTVCAFQLFAYSGPFYVDPAGNDNDDGSSVTPFATLNQALAKMAPATNITSATCFVRPGVYQTRLIIRSNKNPMPMVFKSADPLNPAMIFGAGVSNRGIVVTNANNVVVENLIVKGFVNGIIVRIGSTNTAIRKMTVTSNSLNGIQLMATKTPVSVVSNRISGQTGTGIYVNFCSNTEIRDNYLSMITNQGIYVYYSKATRIANNKVYSNNRNGIYLYYATANSVVSNDLRRSANMMYAGIKIDNSSRNSFTENLVIRKYDGISDNTGSGTNLFSNNTVKSCTSSVGLSLSSHSNVVMGNQFVRNSTAFSLYGANNRIFSNLFHRSASSAIFMANSSSNTRIVGNVFTSNQGYSVNLASDTIERISIVSNIFRANQSYPVYISAADRIEIRNNLIVNPFSLYGIYASDSTNLLLSENAIFSNTSVNSRVVGLLNSSAIVERNLFDRFNWGFQISGNTVLNSFSANSFMNGSKAYFRNLTPSPMKVTNNWWGSKKGITIHTTLVSNNGSFSNFMPFRLFGPADIAPGSDTTPLPLISFATAVVTSGTNVTLTWTKPTPSLGFSKYVIYRTSNPGAMDLTNVSIISISDDINATNFSQSVPLGQSYYYYITTRDDYPIYTNESWVKEVAVILPPYAGPFYVDAAGGNDANAGLPASPFKTIQKAVDRLSTGNNITSATAFIRPGIYQGSIIIRSNANPGWMCLTAASNTLPIISGSLLTNSGVTFSNKAKRVLLEKAVIRKFTSGVVFKSGASTNFLRYASFLSNSTHGVVLGDPSTAANTLFANTFYGLNSACAIKVSNANRNFIVSNHLRRTSAAGSGVFILAGASANLFLRNTITSNGAVGFNINSPSSNSIISNVSRGPGQNNGAFILACKNTLFQNNVFAANSGSGFRNNPGSTNIYFLDNQVYSNSLYGFYDDTGIRNRYERNNVWRNGYGIYMFNAREAAVRSNVFHRNFTRGISLESGAVRIQVEGNTITSNGTGIYFASASTRTNRVVGNIVRAGSYPLYLNAGCHNAVWSNNFIRGIYGLYLGISTIMTQNRIYANTFRSNSSYGVQSFSSKVVANSISNNLFDLPSSTKYGVYFVNSKGYRFERNIIQSGCSNAVYLTSSSNITLNDNVVRQAQKALSLSNSTVIVQRNLIISNQTGLHLFGPNTASLSFNNFLSNTRNLSNHNAPAQNLASNWWGGPTVGSFKRKAKNNGTWSNSQPWRLGTAFDLTPNSDVYAPEIPSLTCSVVSNSIRLLWPASVAPDFSRFNLYMTAVAGYTGATRATALLSTTGTSHNPSPSQGTWDFMATALDNYPVTNESFYSPPQRIYYWQMATSNLLPLPAALSVSTNTALMVDFGNGGPVSSNSLLLKVDGVTALSNGLFRTGFDGPSSSLVRTYPRMRVTIDPVSPLKQLTNYQVYAYGENISGMSKSTSWSFTTADTTKPVYSMLSPGDGVTNVGLTALLSFSVQDNAAFASNLVTARLAGITALTNGVFQPGFTGSVNADGSGKGWDIVIDPVVAFATNQNVPLALLTSDGRGNLSVSNILFTTAKVSAPAISVLNPVSGATGVPITTNIIFQVTDAVSVVSNSITLRVDGLLVLTNGIFHVSFNGGASTVSPIAGGYEVTVDPLLPFTDGTNIVLVASGENNTGLSKTVGWSFSTMDLSKPKISAIQPSPGSSGISPTNSLSFAVSDNYQLSSNAVVLQSGGMTFLSNGLFINSATGRFTPDGSGKGWTILVNPPGFNAPGTSVICGIVTTDAALNQTMTNFSFTVAPASIPQLTSVNPAASAMGVSTNTNIAFTLTDSDGVVSNSIIVRFDSSTLFSNGLFVSPDYMAGSTVTPVAGGFSFVFDRNSPMNDATNHLVSISAKDLYDSVLSTNWVFTTRDSTFPVVTVLSPLPGATNVNPATSISVTFMDNGPISSNSLLVRADGITLLTNALFQASTGNLLRISGGRGWTVTLQPVVPYQTNALINLVVAAIDGGMNQGVSNSSFRISKYQPPVITNIVPAIGTIGVSRDAAFHVTLLGGSSAVVSNSAVIRINNVTAFSDGKHLSAFAGPLSAVSTVTGGFVVVVDPMASFSDGSVVTWDVEVSNLAGLVTVLSGTFSVMTQPQNYKMPEADTAVYPTLFEFKPGASVKIVFKEATEAVIEIRNVRGDLVRRITKASYPAGGAYEWDGLTANGSQVAAGVYLISIESDRFKSRHKIIIRK